MDVLQKQCAWCRRLYRGGVILSAPLPELRPEITQSICRECRAAIVELSRIRSREGTSNQERDERP